MAVAGRFAVCRLFCRRPAEVAKRKQDFRSGIVCLCITDELCQQLALPPMVSDNTSVNKTAFTVTIEAAEGVSTGVSAQDRVTTIKAAIADQAKPTDLHRPGHVFPLRAAEGGVLTRRGHTEASVDLARLSGFKPAGVICEITNDDGTMARAPQIVEFAKKFGYAVVTIEDLVEYKLQQKSRRISGKINAFRKIISERHLIWNAVLVNFRTLCNCYIIPNISKTHRTFSSITEYVHILLTFLSAKRWIALHQYVFYVITTLPNEIDRYRHRW